MIDLGSILFLAQQVVPPLQPGPVRLPRTTIKQRTTPARNPIFERTNRIDSDSPETDRYSKPWSSKPTTWTPDLVGDDFFTDDQLKNTFKTCRQTSVAETLNNCAAKLTALLLSKGYINSRIYVVRTPEPGALEVVLGRISEVNITSSDPELKAQVEKELNQLVGEVLHLPTLEKTLLRLRKRGSGQIREECNGWAAIQPVPRFN